MEMGKTISDIKKDIKIKCTCPFSNSGPDHIWHNCCICEHREMTSDCDLYCETCEDGSNFTKRS